VFAPFVQLKKIAQGFALQICMHFEEIILFLQIMVDGKNITLG
jgi:hypothetical protein